MVSRAFLFVDDEIPVKLVCLPIDCENDNFCPFGFPVMNGREPATIVCLEWFQLCDIRFFHINRLSAPRAVRDMVSAFAVPSLLEFQLSRIP